MANHTLVNKITDMLVRLCGGHFDSMVFYVRELLPVIKATRGTLSVIEYCEILMEYPEITQFFQE